jgi:hypothetical protein
VLNSGVERSHELVVGEVIQRVREQLGPVAAFKLCAVAQCLPKTRSGKILRYQPDGQGRRVEGPRNIKSLSRIVRCIAPGCSILTLLHTSGMRPLQ